MHIPTHLLSGWCIGNCFRFTPRERLFCMIAAAGADIDGIGFFFGEEMYWRLHHYLGHNIFFGAALSIAMAALSRRWALGFIVYFALFHLHLLMDFFGSGPGWKIHYLWPALDTGYKTHLAWELFSWQNLLAVGGLFAWTALIALVAHRTPLELIAPRLNRRCVEYLAFRRVVGQRKTTRRVFTPG